VIAWVAQNSTMKHFQLQSSHCLLILDKDHTEW